MKKRRRGRKLIIIKEIDKVQVCKQGDEIVFILPTAMDGGNFTKFKIDNRKYLSKLKNRIS